MQFDILMLPGDGIGPEIVVATERVMREAAGLAGLSLNFEHRDIGFPALEAQGTTIPDAVIDAARGADGVVLGPVSHNVYPPVAEGGLNPSGVLRVALELYANIRPAKSITGLPRVIDAPVDLVIFRENLEGFYADRNMHAGGGEFAPEPGIGLAMRKITARGSARIATAAFDLAGKRPARRVAAIHKANVMRLTDGIFLEETRRLAAGHGDIAYEEVLVDAAAALLVRDPGRFDVIVTTNMFGDILSDLASELAGGLGMAASLNKGADASLAQAQHGSAPDIAGQDIANPVSLILSSAMLLRDLGADDAACLIETACERTLTRPETRTRDLGGPLGTRAFTDAVIQSMRGDARVA